MSTPTVTIFVRHARDCKWAGEEFAKACRCGKHLRWSQNGKQFRRKAGTGSWEQAEQAKRVLEAQLRGEVAPTANLLPSAMTIREAVELFNKDKRARGLAPGSLSHYKCDLARFLEFCEGRNVFTVALIDAALLYGYRDTWTAHYSSSQTRIMVQKRLRGFLKFCYNSQWLDRIPALSLIKNDAPETMPLTEAEYAALLAAVPKTFPGLTRACSRCHPIDAVERPERAECLHAAAGPATL